MTVMCKENTWKAITKIKGDKRRLLFKRIVGSCDEYMVKPNGNEHFLYGNIILTCWANMYSHYGNGNDPFEHWSFPNDKIASESFTERGFNNDW